jgi:hypothetical protein
MTLTSAYHLIGAGGTGAAIFAPLLRLLANHHQSDTFRLYVHDGKTLDASKLDRQLFSQSAVGQNKAEAIARQYETNPEVVIAVPHYLGADHMSGIETDSTILIAADNWRVRQYIEAHVSTLRDATVINGGNELYDGSVQLWLRRKGRNVTPPMSQGHPEILELDEDMTELSCQQIAELPSGGQTMLANLASALAMLNALRISWDYDAAPRKTKLDWNEAYFDLSTFSMRPATR